WNPLFVEALQKKPYTEYLLDILLSGSMEERACVVAEYGKEVRKIEQRISEFTVGHPAGRHERSRSLSAGAERCRSAGKPLGHGERPARQHHRQLPDSILP